MSALLDHGPATLRQLHKAWNVRQKINGIPAVLGRVERKGLVQRLPKVEGRLVYAVTENGRAVVELGRRLLAEVKGRKRAI